ncbi:MAG: transglutaminase-like domain-containing protein [Polyangiaceae bacterium]
MTRRSAPHVAVLTGFLLASVIGSGTVKADSPAETKGESAPRRWTAATPDEMIQLALSRAQQGGEDALAGLVTAAFLDDRGSFGKARNGLDAIAASTSPLADDARWLSARLKPDPKPSVWPGARVVSYDTPANATGLVTGLAVLGPFQDTGGGGLDKKEGPEAPGESFSDMGARYSWGVYEVAWRRAIPQSVTARGLPLDLYIYPRTESCTIAASKVSFPAGTKKVVLFGAASGTVRLIWDGKTITKSEDVHTKLVLDRLAAEIDVTPGPHLVAAKVCTSAVSDEGRVRLRFTDELRRPISVNSSSDLKGLVLPANEDPKKAEPADAKGKGPAKGAAPAKGAPAKGAPAKGGKGAANAKPADTKGAPKANFAGGGKPMDKPAVTPPKGAAKGGKGAAPAKGGAKPADAPKVEAPPVARPIETSLEKALKIGDSPTTAQVLQSAVLRVLGGADNAASPRAPGLLDKVTTSGAIPVDTLAMAGWIATSGANKSGWLNLALARGLVEGDKASVAFAQRRLAAGHITGSSPEWGLTSIEDQPFKSANDTEARMIRAMAKRRLGGAGLAKLGLDEMVALADELKDAAPVSLWDEISSASYSQPELRLKAVQRLADMRGDARGPTYVRAFRFQGGAAMEAAAAESLVRFTHAFDVANMGRELYDTGRYAWARELYYMATLLGPNRATGFVGLAESRRALIALDPKAKDAEVERQKADQALLRARDLDPGDPTVKAELGLRSGNSKEAVAGREKMRDEDYLPKPEDFLARARKNPAKKGEMFDRQLHWVRVVTYHPDKRISQLMHYAREIVIEPRTDNDLYEPSIPSEGDTELLYAKLYRTDGTVALPEEQSSGGRPFVRWPELHTGDVVEVAVRSWTDGPVGRRGDAPFYFIDYVGSTDTHPILYNEVVVDSAEGSRLAIDVLNGKVEKYDEQKKDGRVIQRYIWENPPIVQEEPLAPRLSEVLPVVVGSTFAGWGEFREWYRGAVKGFTEPDEQTRRLAADLTKGKKTRDEKIRALFDFVADDIRYVNYVSGEWWLPNRPQELLARRQGDCDDKAMLLITLLKSIGIDATEVLVQTRYTAEPSLLRSTKAAIPVFDHGIAFLPGEKGKPGIWLDATSPESRLGPLPSMDSRAVAMFVDEGDAKIIDTPSASIEDHGIDAEWAIKLSPTGAGELTASERHSGDAAFEARMNLKQADARQQWVEQYLSNGFFPTVQVKPEIDFKADLPNGVVTIKYAAQSDGFARREGDELAVPLSETTTLTSQLAPLSKRTLPVALPPNLAPGHQTRAITITAPAGYAFAELPPGGEENGGEFGKAKITFAKGKTKDSVIVTRSVAFDMSVVPVDKYEKWRAWLQRTDRLMHQMVRLVPTGDAKKVDVKTPDAKAAPKVDAGTAKKVLQNKPKQDPKGATKGSKK